MKILLACLPITYFFGPIMKELTQGFHFLSRYQWSLSEFIPDDFFVPRLKSISLRRLFRME